jgi:transaldolase
MTDAGRDGLAETARCHAMAGSTKVLAASLRSADAVAELAAAGVRTFTVSPATASDLLADDLTEAAAEAFERASRGEDEKVSRA